MCDDTTAETAPASIKTIGLRGGIRRKLYVNRTCASKLEPPIVVEDCDTGKRWYARNVKIGDYPHPYGASMWAAEFKWTGRIDTAPALWIETEAKLELTL